MNQMYEIGSTGVILALFIAAVMIVIGFMAMPVAVRVTAVAAALMFLGYQIVEFILMNFIVISL